MKTSASPPVKLTIGEQHRAAAVKLVKFLATKVWAVVKVMLSVQMLL